MPPLITPGAARIFTDWVRELALAAAKEVAKEMSRAANKEVAAEFVEELAKEIMQNIVKEWLKRSTREQGPEDRVQEDQQGMGMDEIWVGGLKVQEENIDEIIIEILYGHLGPSVDEVKDQQDGQLTLPDARGGKDETELPPPLTLQDDRAQKLFKEIESLQKEWIAVTLAQTMETTPKRKWSWDWWLIIIGGVAVILLAGGAYLLYRWYSGSGSGGRNGGGGAGEDGRGAVALGQQEQGDEGEALGQQEQEQEQGFGSDAPPQNQAGHPLGPVGLQILLCGSDLPSGPLACRRIVSIDRLVPAARGTRNVAAAHPVPLTLPADTAIIAEGLEEITVAAIVEESTKLQMALKEECEDASRGACLIEKSEWSLTPAASCLEKGFQELIINLLSHDTEENITMEEDALKRWKSVHLPLAAGPIGTALCV